MEGCAPRVRTMDDWMPKVLEHRWALIRRMPSGRERVDVLYHEAAEAAAALALLNDPTARIAPVEIREEGWHG